MHTISSRWRKPKGRPSKRRKNAKLNSLKRSFVADKNSVNIIDDRKDDDDFENSVTEAKENAEFAVCDSSEKTLLHSPKYTILDDTSFSSLLSKVPCSICDSINCLRVLTGQSYGYSENLELICSECGHSFGKTFTSVREESSRKFEVNKDIVKAFLAIGKGHAALETFSMILGMPTMDKKTFSKNVEVLSKNNVEIKTNVLKASRDLARKAHLELNPLLKKDDVIDISVSYDGSWQKRGHTSLYGIGAVIDTVTGLVLDYEVLSKYCPECVSATRDLGEKSTEFQIWFEGHKASCQNNFHGSSASMEMNAALVIWKRSIEANKMRYITILSDGDAKTHQYLNENKVYGSKISIMKEECINHVSKRLGTSLRNKITECRAKGITISGRKRGSLKDTTVVKLQNFYRKAIKDNAPDIDKMKTAIFASLYHCKSTDKRPQHNKCPTGESSWCFYQRAKACDEVPQSHNAMSTQLAEDVVAQILPIYQRLASDELLRRCVSAKTQNANETLHSCIWKKCPKEIFVSKKRLELSVTAAVSEFNLGCTESLKLMSKDAPVSCNSIAIAQKKDTRREKQKIRRSSETYKKPALKRKIQKLASDAKKVKKEGITYGAGLF